MGLERITIPFYDLNRRTGVGRCRKRERRAPTHYSCHNFYQGNKIGLEVTFTLKRKCICGETDSWTCLFVKTKCKAAIVSRTALMGPDTTHKRVQTWARRWSTCWYLLLRLEDDVTRANAEMTQPRVEPPMIRRTVVISAFPPAQVTISGNSESTYA